MKNNEIKNNILDRIKAHLMKKEEIKFAYVMGTFLSNDDFQDIDLALFLDESTLTSVDVTEYEIDASLELESSIKPGRSFARYVPVDVKVINTAPVTFRYSVSRGEVLFCRDGEAREEFLCRTWKEYFDFRYILDRYYREVIDG